MMKLKVCGLTKLDQIQELISMKVDFLGFIFYGKSPRYVLNHLSLKEISEIPHFGKVGVFVNENIENVMDFSVKANLNFIQLHGDEDENYIVNLKNNLPFDIEIIKVIRIGNQTTEELQKTINHQPSTINHFLFDTDSIAFGGTGKSFDWNLLNELEIPIPYFLSGGISLENVYQLPTLNTQPISLDINSKFEFEPGNKDLEKIKEFIKLYNTL